MPENQKFSPVDITPALLARYAAGRATIVFPDSKSAMIIAHPEPLSPVDQAIVAQAQELFTAFPPSSEALQQLFRHEYGRRTQPENAILVPSSSEDSWQTS